MFSLKDGKYQMKKILFCKKICEMFKEMHGLQIYILERKNMLDEVPMIKYYPQ